MVSNRHGFSGVWHFKSAPGLFFCDWIFGLLLRLLKQNFHLTRPKSDMKELFSKKCFAHPVIPRRQKEPDVLEVVERFSRLMGRISTEGNDQSQFIFPREFKSDMMWGTRRGQTDIKIYESGSNCARTPGDCRELLRKFKPLHVFSPFTFLSDFSKFSLW